MDRDDVRAWLNESGESQEELARLSQVDPSTLSKWLLGTTKSLSAASHAAVCAAIRALGKKRAKPKQKARKRKRIRSSADMQGAARLATSECIALWREIVSDSDAPLQARQRAAEQLMSFAWGKPPKLQVEKKIIEPGSDRALLEIFQRAANGS